MKACSIVLLLALVVTPFSFAAGPSPIKNFGKVTNSIYRGAHPGEAGIAALSRMGVTTILNLENAQGAQTQELKIARRYGIRVISVPMSMSREPSDAQIQRALKAMENGSSNRLIYVHCKHGQDRTGLVVGLYRVNYQRWSSRAAWNEMLEYGYHPKYENLTKTFESYAQ